MHTSRIQAFVCRYLADLAINQQPSDAALIELGFTDAEKQLATRAFEGYRQRLLTEASILDDLAKASTAQG